MLCKFKGEISLGITNAREGETRGKKVNFNNVEQGAEAGSATFLAFLLKLHQYSMYQYQL